LTLEYLKLSWHVFPAEEFEVEISLTMEDGLRYRITKANCIYGMKETDWQKADVPFAEWIYTMDHLGIYKWDPLYFDYILDGTEWNLEYKGIGKEPIKVRGSNACPEGFRILAVLVNAVLKRNVISAAGLTVLEHGEDDEFLGAQRVAAEHHKH